MHRYVKKLGGKRKSMKTTEVGKTSVADKARARQEFIDTMARFDPKDVISIDEVGFSNITNRLKYYTFQNKDIRKYIVKRQHWNCVAAVNHAGFVSWQIEKHAINSNLFLRFVNKIVNRPEKCIILDNINFHKNLQVKKRLEAHGKTVIRIPPYQPVCNPIEFAFSLVKRDYRLAQGFSMQSCMCHAFKVNQRAMLMNAFNHSLGRAARVPRSRRRS